MVSNVEYITYYILSLFNRDSSLNSAQLIHIFHGRRTPSMLFKVEKEKLYSAFGLFKTLKKSTLDQQLKKLVEMKWIESSENKGYKLSKKGSEVLKEYFLNRDYPDKIVSLENATIRKSFFYQFQLVSQIFSEATYKNKQYSPTIKDPVQQVAVKEWLTSLDKPLLNLAKDWSSELEIILEKLTEEEAMMLVWKLTGHELVGNTNRQLAEILSLDTVELYILLDQIVEQLIYLIDKSECTLLKSFLHQINENHYYGLSKSTYVTAVYIKNRIKLVDIALKRNLKLSTIHEHILEVTLVKQTFNFKPFIPDEIYQQLHQAFKKDPYFNFQKAKQENKNLQFLWYRLVEIERIRNESINN